MLPNLSDFLGVGNSNERCFYVSRKKDPQSEGGLWAVLITVPSEVFQKTSDGVASESHRSAN